MKANSIIENTQLSTQTDTVVKESSKTENELKSFSSFSSAKTSAASSSSIAAPSKTVPASSFVNLPDYLKLYRTLLPTESKDGYDTFKAPFNGRDYIVKKVPLASTNAKKIYNEYQIIDYIRKYCTGISNGSIPLIVVLFQESGMLIEIMEAPPGLSLKNTIKMFSTPTQAIARFIFKGILDIMMTIHLKNIAHRNLCLENIYIHPVTHQVCLFNFENVSTKCTEFTSEKVGAELYNSMHNSVYYPKQKDVYALGVILYMLVFGLAITQRVDGQDVELAPTEKYITYPWSNRKNWKIHRTMLKDRGSCADEVSNLKDLLQNLLSKCANSRLTIPAMHTNKWISEYHLASESELKDYFSKTNR
jgi:serine/threonine protein kinase